MCLKIAPDAIFIADSHFSAKSSELLAYLQSLQSNPPSQLFLMGDIAQVLVGHLKCSIESNFELLVLLDSLEQKGVQIIWFEGNHDLFLESIQKSNLLQKTKFIPRKNQPLIASYLGKTYLLAHGDLFLNIGYELYIRTLTNIPHFLRFVDYLSAGEIYRELEQKLQDKPIKKHNFHFFEFASKRIEAYKNRIKIPFDGIIEGHFHIGKKLQLFGINYISLSSFYFTQKGIEITSILKS